MFFKGNEKRMVSSWTGNPNPQPEEPKPALPKRLMKKVCKSDC